MGNHSEKKLHFKVESAKYIISYCLFGDNPRYFDALISNVRFVCSNYDDLFSIMVFIEESVPSNWIDELQESGAIVRSYDKRSLNSFPKTLYRIQPIIESQGLGCFLRDADSYLSVDEMDSMIRFIESDYSYHIVRDHPNHLAPIMAGLFGIKRRGYNLFSSALLENQDEFVIHDKDWWSSNKSAARDDEMILADYVYPLVYKDSYIESNFTIYMNEKNIVNKCLISNYKESFMGQIDPKYNPSNECDMGMYRAGFRRIYLPFWLLKIVRYRFLYRFNWRMQR